MSRDFTPLELHASDEVLKREGKGSLKDAIIKWQLSDGKTYNEAEDELLNRYKKTYPELMFLWDNARGLARKDNKDVKRVFKMLEEDIEKALKLIDEGKTPEDNVITKWLRGKLSDSFYYNTQNNAMLYAYANAMSKAYQYTDSNVSRFFKTEEGKVYSVDDIDETNGDVIIDYLEGGSDRITLFDYQSYYMDNKDVTRDILLEDVRMYYSYTRAEGETISHALGRVASDLADSFGYDFGSYEIEGDEITFSAETDSSVDFYCCEDVFKCKLEEISKDIFKDIEKDKEETLHVRKALKELIEGER